MFGDDLSWVLPCRVPSVYHQRVSSALTSATCVVRVSPAVRSRPVRCHARSTSRILFNPRNPIGVFFLSCQIPHHVVLYASAPGWSGHVRQPRRLVQHSPRLTQPQTTLAPALKLHGIHNTVEYWQSPALYAEHVNNAVWAVLKPVHQRSSTPWSHRHTILWLLYGGFLYIWPVPPLT